MLSAQRACYSAFKNNLERSGFLVYPVEFDCGNSDHPLVDVAARMGSFYWAFEYKSRNDSVPRGVEQVKSYSEWFDYVVLVSERPLRHTASRCYWDLRALGAGIWNYHPMRDKCIAVKNPSIQAPNRDKRKMIERRFRSLYRLKSKNATQFAVGSPITKPAQDIQTSLSSINCTVSEN